MSLILEALKKAERQHKLGEVPKITADTEQPVSGASHRLGWLMMALLAMILLGVGIYLGSSWMSPQQQQLNPSVSHAAPAALESGQARQSDRVEPFGGGETISASDPAQSTVPAQAAVEPPPVESIPREAMIEPAQVATPEPPPPPPVQSPPKPLHEMPSGFVANLPAMSIDIHSYDKRPAKRYVLINMEKYREGDYLAEGPRVVEILPEGAVMEHMGERFILPIGN